jgi:hypothetical protein
MKTLNIRILLILTVICFTISGCSKSFDGIEITVVPLAPSNLIGVVASTTQINLQWVDRSTNETGFKIERKTGSGTFVVIGTNATDMTTFNDTGLTPSTTYIYRVYSYNAVGNSLTYSNELTLTTRSIITLPTLTTTTVSLITDTASVSGGTISSDGGASVTARGVCWSTSPNPTSALSTKTTAGTGIGSFENFIIGLKANTTYYIRAYATNSVGTAYGNELTFSTQVADIISGLVAHFPFNSNANDISGNSNNGIVTNATLTSDRFGNSNKAYLFNGDSSYIRVPNSSRLSSSNFQLTISAWVKIKEFTGSPNKSASIVNKESGQSGSWGLYYQDWDADSTVEKLRFTGHLKSNSKIVLEGRNTTTVPKLNQWFHLVFIIDGSSTSNTSRYYINGLLESSTSSASFPLYGNNADMYIGRSGSIYGTHYGFLGSNYNYFKGVIDDVRIYNRALKSNEVNYLFNQN